VTRYGLDQADAARIVVEQGRLVQSEQRPSQQSVLLGCILATLLLVMGVVGVMMALLKGMR